MSKNRYMSTCYVHGCWEVSKGGSLYSSTASQAPPEPPADATDPELVTQHRPQGP
jgi:hypothetical protein